MKEIDKNKIYDDVHEYCQRYNIPIENLLEILENQKVLPMIRGKATEYIAAAMLKNVLDRNWQVQKLNLNAHLNAHDEDISITHSKTGYRLKVEAKNAVRGSFKMGNTRTKIRDPHFRVKCHKSRSNINLRNTTNDRYLLGDFDVIVCNVSNAIFQNKTLGDELEVIQNSAAIGFLQEHYKVDTKEEIIRAAYDDWRYCFPKSIIQEDKSVPRTPSVILKDDTHWRPFKELKGNLLTELQNLIKD